jgi:hypothetical protein
VNEVVNAPADFLREVFHGIEQRLISLPSFARTVKRRPSGCRLSLVQAEKQLVPIINVPIIGIGQGIGGSLEQ